jgi:hypothetical protein
MGGLLFARMLARRRREKGSWMRQIVTLLLALGLTASFAVAKPAPKPAAKPAVKNPHAGMQMNPHAGMKTNPHAGMGGFHGGMSAHSGVKAANKGRKMTAKECSIACTKAMNAKGMAGSCPESLCKTNLCPMHDQVVMAPAQKGTPKTSPKKGTRGVRKAAPKKPVAG